MLLHFQYPSRNHAHAHDPYRTAKRHYPYSHKADPTHSVPSILLLSFSSFPLSLVTVRASKWVLLRSRCTVWHRCIRIFQKVRQVDDRCPIWEDRCCCIIVVALSGGAFVLVEQCLRDMRIGDLSLRRRLIAEMIIGLRRAWRSSSSSSSGCGTDQNTWALL